jgi:hypothetical protein
MAVLFKLDQKPFFAENLQKSPKQDIITLTPVSLLPVENVKKLRACGLLAAVDLNVFGDDRVT